MAITGHYQLARMISCMSITGMICVCDVKPGYSSPYYHATFPTLGYITGYYLIRLTYRRFSADNTGQMVRFKMWHDLASILNSVIMYSSKYISHINLSKSFKEFKSEPVPVLSSDNNIIFEEKLWVEDNENTFERIKQDYISKII